MSKPCKIYLAQVNTSVGNLDHNYQKIIDHLELANQKNCDLIIFPEMTISGYPCQDLWKKKYFVEDCEQSIMAIVEYSKSIKTAIIIGSPTTDLIKNKLIIRNSAILIINGKMSRIFYKKSLPNYGVFDEKRYFESASSLSYFEFNQQNFVILICEDLWDKKNWLLLNEQVCDNIIIINSSPFEAGKHLQRIEHLKDLAKTSNKSIIYVNQVGAQDSLVFDGSSMVVNANGEVIAQLNNFSEDQLIVNLAKDHQLEIIEHQDSNQFSSDNFSQIYQAMVLGIRDYLAKNNFKKVLLGLSGGIDSALVAMIAVDAIGSSNVSLYALPSKFNSEQSMIDARQCANNLGIELQVISIDQTFEQLQQHLLQNNQSLNDLSLENLQSRIRGNILMTISNASNSLLLSTGNKSELACGYATIYGDMCGAFNPIKDLYKTQVYQITNWRNNNFCKISKYQKLHLIPENILTKSPSAELRFNQLDSDSLPEYDLLDQILYGLIEQQKSVQELHQNGFELSIVKRINDLLLASEYKRSQAVIGVKLSPMAFDKDRRYPITNGYKK
jgi:NAD+ synthetase